MPLLLLLLTPTYAAPPSAGVIIHDTVIQQASRIRHCYVRARLMDPEMSGKLVVNFTIRNGTAQDIHLERDDIGDAALSTCVQDVFWLMPFSIPEADSSEVVVRYPFVFVHKEERKKDKSPKSVPTQD